MGLQWSDVVDEATSYLDIARYPALARVVNEANQQEQLAQGSSGSGSDTIAPEESDIVNEISATSASASAQSVVVEAKLEVGGGAGGPSDAAGGGGAAAAASSGDPLAQFVASLSPVDRAAYEEILRAGLSPAEAQEAFAAAKGVEEERLRSEREAASGARTGAGGAVAESRSASGDGVG